MRGTLSLIGCMLLLLVGCSNPHPFGLAMPDVVHPGPEPYQQARARIFEPYPENDTGPPIAGGRPREYQNELAEPDRVMPRPGEVILWPYSRAAAPPPPAQPPVVTAPPAIYNPPCVQPVAP